MPYISLKDRPIVLELYPVNANLWGVRLPGGRFRAHGSTPELAVANAYTLLNCWRLDRYQFYDCQNEEYAQSRRALSRIRKKETIQNSALVVTGEERKIGCIEDFGTTG